MGRTVPTYRLHTESIINEWMDYRRALREKDREVFDELMYKARLHSSAGSYTAHLDPVATMFLSILLEMQREICSLRGSHDSKKKDDIPSHIVSSLPDVY